MKSMRGMAAVVVAVMGLAACGGGSDEPTAVPAPAVETPAAEAPAAEAPAAEPATDVATAPDATPAATPAAPAQQPLAEPAAPAPPLPGALTLAALPAPYNEANLADGAMEFAKCRSCHSTDAAAGNLIGPNLHGLFSRAPGEAANFRYSPAMEAFEREIWTPQDLDAWLEKPSEFLPGSSMFFNGMSNAKARRNLIGWLMLETAK